MTGSISGRKERPDGLKLRVNGAVVENRPEGKAVVRASAVLETARRGAIGSCGQRGG